MGDYSSGNTQVSGTVTTTINSLGYPAPGSGQTIVEIKAQGAGSQQNAYTVTTGKTLYLFEANIAGNAVSSNVMDVYANDGTTLNFELNPASTKMISGGFPIAVYTSGQVVKVSVTNTIWYNLRGFEQ